MQRSNRATDAAVATENDLRQLMEEPPGGTNHGRAASADPATFGRHETLGTTEHDFEAGGFSIVDTAYGSTAGTSIYGAVDAGMTSHRGVLRPHEYVDADELRVQFENAFGFTVDAVHSVYRQGRLSADQGELRARIDARLLALSRAGANMTAVCRVLGFEGTPGTWPRPLKNALARARAAEGLAA